MQKIKIVLNGSFYDEIDWLETEEYTLCRYIVEKINEFYIFTIVG